MQEFKKGDLVRVYRRPTVRELLEDWISDMDLGVGKVATIRDCDFSMGQAELEFEEFPLPKDSKLATNGPSGWFYWFGVLEAENGCPDQQVEERMEEAERQARANQIREGRQETIYLVIIYGTILLAAWVLATSWGRL